MDEPTYCALCGGQLSASDEQMYDAQGQLIHMWRSACERQIERSVAECERIYGLDGAEPAD